MGATWHELIRLLIALLGFHYSEKRSIVMFFRASYYYFLESVIGCFADCAT